ncbi:TVP38/TMEM64 family protein [Fictibacillus phosphorivorans]|uniref:TVP38/TMEM64 family protein n=1 Tax=Fictibacillus phosphorivorans TaxID=1221500 RepID=UPI00203BD983|nr:TVP38/TMEM64 family protein [Fictibacillus phosphorivorans]MCM3719664.1 TVP38/TMEM64 family protein [Fictibacillus phosphorivorans]MCM3777355.1 TVP38/TMEM64 family protein [Fictibacillus phosphorivorans]
MKITKKWMLIIFSGVILVLLIVWLQRNYKGFSPQEFRNWIMQWGLLAPFLFILLYTFRPLVLFPSSIFAITSGLSFGFYWGCLYTYLGSLGGGLITYYAVNRFGQFKKYKQWKNERYNKIRSNIEREGFRYVLLLRLLPILNFDLVSYLTAITKVKFKDYAIATAIGIIPGTIAYTYLGTSMTAQSKEVIWIGTTLLFVIVGLPLVFKKRMKTRVGL